MDIVWGGSKNPQERNAMAAWCASHIWPDKPHKQFGECVTMGVMHRGEPIACMVFHDWEPDAGVIEFSGAAISQRWITRQTLKAMFDYPFVTLGVQLLVTRNSAKGHQSHLHRMLNSYGFKSQTIRRLFGRDEDCLLWTMTDDEWRASKFNQPAKRRG